MTYVAITNETSINRINYGVSFQQLRASKIAISDYVFDYIVNLPHSQIAHKNEIITACNANSRNQTRTETQKLMPPNDTPFSIDCSQVIDSLIKTLLDTDKDIHREVEDLITKIYYELPDEVTLKQGKLQKRSWFKAIGSVFHTVFGTMDEEDSDKIEERLEALESYTDDSSKTTRMEVNRLVTGEKLLQAKVDDVLQELRLSTITLTGEIEARTVYVLQALDWMSVFQNKALLLVHKGRKLTDSLKLLLRGVRELNYGRLSHDIVPYTTLEETLEHVKQKIRTQGETALYIIPQTVKPLHKQPIVHDVHVEDHLIISLLVPLTANVNDFICYKIIKHDITVPNSDISTRLETDEEYIAIERESMQYAYITELEANSLQMDKDYLLRKKIIYKENVNDCITAVFLNNHTSIKLNCKYNVYQKDTRMQVTQYDDNKFYLRNTLNYTIQCSIENIFAIYQREYIRHYQCLQDCLVDVDNIRPEINITNGDWTTHCIIKTNAWNLHFKPSGGAKISQGQRYLINLAVLSRQYTDEQIQHLDSYTELKTIARIDMPKIKIIFYEGDPLFNIKLDTLLNQTDNDKEMIASVYRDPDFINKLRLNDDSDITGRLGMGLAGLSLIGVIYLLIKQRRLMTAVIIIKSQLSSGVRALYNLQLTQRPKTTEMTQPNMHEVILNISTNYWFYLIAILLVLAVARKVCKFIWIKCTSALSKNITESSIILYMSNGQQNVYLKIQNTNGRPQNLTIRSVTYLNQAKIIGYIWPKLHFVWEASVFNSMNQQTTQIKQVIKLSQYEAYLTRKVVKEAFHCHLLLFQDNKLDVIARVNENILPGCQHPTSTTALLGYDIVSSPRNQLYPTAPHL